MQNKILALMQWPKQNGFARAMIGNQIVYIMANDTIHRLTGIIHSNVHYDKRATHNDGTVFNIFYYYAGSTRKDIIVEN